jgi:hypothetical protein
MRRGEGSDTGRLRNGESNHLPFPLVPALCTLVLGMLWFRLSGLTLVLASGSDRPTTLSDLPEALW